jgi:hypothetical protein
MDGWIFGAISGFGLGVCLGGGLFSMVFRLCGVSWSTASAVLSVAGMLVVLAGTAVQVAHSRRQ